MADWILGERTSSEPVVVAFAAHDCSGAKIRTRTILSPATHAKVTTKCYLFFDSQCLLLAPFPGERPWERGCLLSGWLILPTNSCQIIYPWNQKKQMYLKKLLRLSSGHVILRSPFKIILILFTVHVSVNSFASQTVRLITHGAMERIDVILIQTPPPTVWSFAVEAVCGLTLRCSETAVQELVEIFFWQ